MFILCCPDPCIVCMKCCHSHTAAPRPGQYTRCSLSLPHLAPRLISIPTSSLTTPSYIVLPPLTDCIITATYCVNPISLSSGSTPYHRPSDTRKHHHQCQSIQQWRTRPTPPRHAMYSGSSSSTSKVTRCRRERCVDVASLLSYTLTCPFSSFLLSFPLCTSFVSTSINHVDPYSMDSLRRAQLLLSWMRMSSMCVGVSLSVSVLLLMLMIVVSTSLAHSSLGPPTGPASFFVPSPPDILPTPAASSGSSASLTN